jgi:hypothetical protein
MILCKYLHVPFFVDVFQGFWLQRELLWQGQQTVAYRIFTESSGFVSQFLFISLIISFVYEL